MNNNIELSDVARELHADMLRSNTDGSKLFTQKELQNKLPGNNPTLADLMLVVQELLDKNLIKLVKQNNELKFQSVDFQEAAKKSTMSNEEALVYSYIEASGREGIWSKTIKARTNLHQHVVLKCLKSLESQRYVKSVKSVKYPTRKMYMLYHLQPSVEVTGGPWFTEGELDVEFINSLLTIIWRYVAQNSFPNGFQTVVGRNDNSKNGDVIKNKSSQYSPHVRSYSTTQEILDFISSAGVANVELSTANIRSLCTVLVYDDRLEEVEFNCYRATLTSVAQLVGPIDEGSTSKNNSSKLLDEMDEFYIFDYHQIMGPSGNDKEAVYFDEWAL